MKILIVHNHYLERGGEDEVVDSEIKMLKDSGHEVIFYERSNKDLANLSFLQKIIFLSRGILWSRATYKEITEIARKEKPDIAHIHNIFFSITPAVHSALYKEKIPVVQTLHNFRFICLNGVFYRNEVICEKCIKSCSMFSIIYRCRRKSFLPSVFLANTLAFLRSRAFKDKINAFIALSEFSKSKFIEAGFPEEKFFIKPNFVDLEITKREKIGDYGLFVGRLVDYKGLDTLISAYNRLGGAYRLKIIGDGPMHASLKEKIANASNIEMLGSLPHETTIEYIKKSAFLILPSRCYENMPRVIIEGYACGVPSIVSNIGALRELVRDKISGLLFDSGDSDDLAGKIKYLTEKQESLIRMGENARRDYEEKYSVEKNYSRLMDIYKSAISGYS